MLPRLTTLPNGLRVITDHVPEMHSTALGIWVDVGTRYEEPQLNGIAHLIEHMIFKGTDKIGAQAIAEKVESVGGQMNAFTSREQTAYYIHLLKEDVPLALNLLAEILQRPAFPEADLNKERHVIIQEIGVYKDTPDELVFDLHNETAYPNQGLGAPILGTEEIIRTMPRQALFDYVKKYYTPSQMVVSAAGFVEHEDFVKLVEDAFGALPGGAPPIAAPPANYVGGECRVAKELEQVHLVMGYQGVSRLSPDYYAMTLLATLFGGGMSSRLFQEIREKRGLVYTVYSQHTAYRDDGHFEIYAGTGSERVAELLPLIDVEIERITSTLASETELSRARAQIKAGLLMGQESMLGRANRQAKYLLNFGTTLDLPKTLEALNAVTPEKIQSTAQSLFTTPRTFTMLGPNA